MAKYKVKNPRFYYFFVDFVVNYKSIYDFTNIGDSYFMKNKFLGFILLFTLIFTCFTNASARNLKQESSNLKKDNCKYSDDSSNFVILSEAVPDVILEIRYYSTYNFVGDRIDGYEQPVALITKPAAEASQSCCRMQVTPDPVITPISSLRILYGYSTDTARYRKRVL